jgi:hypothetical protein
MWRPWGLHTGVAAPPRITDADRRLLELLAEHRVIVALHAARWLGVSTEVADRRLRGLAERRLIRREAIFSGQPAAAWIARRGLDAIGSDRPVPRLDLKGYRHDVGVAWLWLAAAEGAFGPLAAQHSEREMRSSDHRADAAGDAGAPRFGVGLAGAGPRGGPLRHYPDMLLRTAGGHRLALELELTPKSTRRLDRIMLAYAADHRIDGVIYLVPTRTLAGKVAGAARRAGIADRVQVQLLAPGSPAGAPDPGRAPASRRPPARSAAHSR